MEAVWGILLVTLAGLGTGTVAWPMKLMRRLKFEHYWFVGMLVGLIIIPWAVVFLSVDDPLGAYGEVISEHGWGLLVVANLWGIGWGIANVLYGVCVVRIGAALTGAILSGLGVTIGVTLPMIFKGSGVFEKAADLTSPAGLAVTAGVAVMLLGVVISSVAGFGRDRVLKKTEAPARQASGGFLGGLVMVAVAGITSSGIALSFVYGQGPIIAAMKSHGAGEVSANFAVWAAALSGGALVNVLYPAYLMTKNRSWGVLTRCWSDVALGALIGLQFVCAIALLGSGMRMLGALGASVGFGIQQAMQIMGNQTVGFLSGEWRDVAGPPRMQMYLAIAILLAAVVIMAFGNCLTGG